MPDPFTIRIFVPDGDPEGFDFDLRARIAERERSSSVAHSDRTPPQ
jgi:hypothetical protein